KPENPLNTAAKAHGVSVVQVALAWLLERSPVMLPIPGTSSLAHLEQNVAAAKLKLTPEEWKAIDALAGWSLSGRRRSRCSRRRRHAGIWTEDWNRRHATTTATTFVRLLPIGDEQRRTGYRLHGHVSGTRYDHSIADFRKVLRIASGTKINS